MLLCSVRTVGTSRGRSIRDGEFAPSHIAAPHVGGFQCSQARYALALACSQAHSTQDINTNSALCREWFTFCFIPIVPFSLKPWKEVGCHICNFWQDIKYVHFFSLPEHSSYNHYRFRPDVTNQHGPGQVPLQPYGNPNDKAGGPPPQQPLQYPPQQGHEGGQPVYK
jgi:hypothetical protein